MLAHLLSKISVVALMINVVVYAPNLAAQVILKETPPKILTAKAPAHNAGDDELHKLKIERYTLALEDLRTSFNRFSQHSNSTFILKYAFRLQDVTSRLVLAYKALEPTKVDLIVMQTDIVELMKYIEKRVQATYNAGGVDGTGIKDEDLSLIKYYRLSSEIELLELKKAAK